MTSFTSRHLFASAVIQNCNRWEVSSLQPLCKCNYRKVCTYSLLLATRCPPLSCSPHPRLSLRLGESFLLCVSPPCRADARGQARAPSSLSFSSWLLLLTGHWSRACKDALLFWIDTADFSVVSPSLTFSPLSDLRHPLRSVCARRLLSAPLE